MWTKSSVGKFVKVGFNDEMGTEEGTGVLRGESSGLAESGDLRELDGVSSGWSSILLFQNLQLEIPNKGTEVGSIFKLLCFCICQ